MNLVIDIKYLLYIKLKMYFYFEALLLSFLSILDISLKKLNFCHKMMSQSIYVSTPWSSVTNFWGLSSF